MVYLPGLTPSKVSSSDCSTYYELEVWRVEGRDKYLAGEVYSHGKDADIIWWRKGHDDGGQYCLFVFRLKSFHVFALPIRRSARKTGLPRFTRGRDFFSPQN